MTRNSQLLLVVLMNLFCAHASLAFLDFGQNFVALMQIVSGQVRELEELASMLDAAHDQVAVLRAINDGIDRTTQHLEHLEMVAKRAQGLNPTSAKRLSDITNLIHQLKGLHEETAEVLALRLDLSESAISQASLQSETAYSTGGELVRAGTLLSMESEHASPGRAAQITAASSAGTMVAQGAELQMLSHMTNLQAAELDLRRSEMSSKLRSEQASSKSTVDILKERSTAHGTKGL